MTESGQLLLLFCILATNGVFGEYQYQSRDPIYAGFLQYFDKTEVKLHKLCTWNVLQWENPIIHDTSNNSCNLNYGLNYIPSANIPTSFAFYNDTVFVGVRRRSTGVYSTLNYFKLCDIVDHKCPKLRPYPSHQLTEFLSEECSHHDQIISVERFSVDKCLEHPKLWVFDTKGYEIKNKPYLFGEPSLKIFCLKTNTVLRSRTIPSYLFDHQIPGIVQVIVHVASQSSSCENTFAYLVDSTHGSLIVYSWKDDRFWRYETPKFYGDAKYSDFTINTPSGRKVTYYPKTHLHEVTVDLCNNQLLYHARGSLSTYAIDLDTVNNAKVSKIGATKFGVTFVGDKNARGQTGSQAMNNELCTVWGIQEQNHAITCYNRKKSLSPDAIKIVMADSDRLSFLVDLKLEPEPKYCFNKKTSVLEDFQRFYTSQISKNVIYVLTNNEKDIANGYFDPNYENFGIYFIEEDAALKSYPQCQPHYKDKFEPPSVFRKPYMPPKPQDLTTEKPFIIQTTEPSTRPVTPTTKEDSYEIEENLLKKSFQPKPERHHKQLKYHYDYENPTFPNRKMIQTGYDKNSYETIPHQYKHKSKYSYDPYYYKPENEFSYNEDEEHDFIRDRSDEDITIEK